jgi:hypothetical protein
VEINLAPSHVNERGGYAGTVILGSVAVMIPTKDSSVGDVTVSGGVSMINNIQMVRAGMFPNPLQLCRGASRPGKTGVSH